MLVLGTLGCTEAPSPNVRHFEADVPNGTLAIAGTWQMQSGESSIDMPRTNSVRLDCDRATGVCYEALAKLLLPSDEPSVPRNGYLFIFLEKYRVVEWTEAHVIARAQPLAADVEVRIGLQDSSAERSSRETGARGAQGADPTRVLHWVLR